MTEKRYFSHPQYPDDVNMAKHLKYAIGDRAEVGGGEDTYDLETGVFKVEGRLLVGATADAHIAGIGGARTTKEDIEDMDSDQIPPISVITCSQRQVSPIRPRRATNSSSAELIDILKMQTVTDATERKSKREKMDMDREERIEETREAEKQLQFKRQGKAADRAVLIQMITSAMGGYLGAQEKSKRKRKKKKEKRRCVIFLG